MNIKDYAVIILQKQDSNYRQKAIANLKHGLKHEEKWNDQHKKEVKQLVKFLESDSTDIEDLEKYQ
jgi:N-dimethylarginine dimethylaminohydrolase